MKRFFTIFSLVVLTFGATSSATAQYNAFFNWKKDGNTVPLRYNFTDASSIQLGVTARLWDFDDNSSSTAQNPSHDFSIPGKYKVTLTVWWGFVSDVVEREINVSNTVDFHWSQPAYILRSVDFFDDTPYRGWCTDILTYRWTFGDGKGLESTTKNTSYQYDQPGDYTVTLCVKDQCNYETCQSKTVKVLMPANDLVPSFVANTNNWTASKGSTVTFYDRSTPQSSIKWWEWWFEQPGNLTSDEPVVGGNTEFYLNHKETVTHKFNRAGTYTVRLYVGDRVLLTEEGGYPIADYPGVYYDRTIKIYETPEPTPGATKTATYTFRDFVQGDQYAAVMNANASDYSVPQRITVYEKNGGSGSETWDLKQRWKYPANETNTRICGMKMSGTSLLLQLQPSNTSLKYQYYVVPVLSTPMSIDEENPPGLNSSWITAFGQHLGVPSGGQPQCDIHNQEIAIVQKEDPGNLYVYVSKIGSGNWNGSLSKNLIASSYTGKPGKIFMDDNAIVTKVGNQIYIFEKQGSNWNFATKKVINLPAGDDPDNEDFGYANNVVAATLAATSGKTAGGEIAYIYEKPTAGWPAVTTYTSGQLTVESDLDFAPNTRIFLDPDNISIAGDYAVLKVRLVTGSNNVIRKYSYKRKNGYWRSPTFPSHKFLQASKQLGVQTTNTDMMNLLPGRLEFYNYESYCWRTPYVRTDFTLNTSTLDVTESSITLGGSGKLAIMNPNSSIQYKAINTTLLPGFQAKAGSQVIIKSVVSCDDLYSID